jgi:hypothetical protein
LFLSCSTPCSIPKLTKHASYNDYGTREQDYHINIIIIGVYNRYVTPNANVLIYAREACFLYQIKGDGLMLEKQIEAKLRRDVKNSGGVALKFISPGTAGVPDRLILLPKGKLAFVELKAPGCSLRPLQQKRKDQLEDLGFRVYIIDSITGVSDFLREVTG